MKKYIIQIYFKEKEQTKTETLVYKGSLLKFTSEYKAHTFATERLKNGIWRKGDVLGYSILQFFELS